MYYIGTVNECNEYNEMVYTGEKYVPPTLRWATIIKKFDEELYAILKHDKYEYDMMLLNELPKNWFNTEEFEP